MGLSRARALARMVVGWRRNEVASVIREDARSAHKKEWNIVEMWARLWCAGAVRIAGRAGRSDLDVLAQGSHSE